MKTFISLLLLLGACTAFASPVSPLNLDGTFKFNGELKNFSVQENRVVYAFTSAGAAELQNLQKQDYLCSNTGREIYLCQKEQANDVLSAKVQARLQQKFQNFSVSFLERFAQAPSLQTDAPSFTEWVISQKAQLGNRSWDHFRYQILEGRLHKIALGDAGAPDTQYFVVASQTELQYMYSETESFSNGYFVYLGFATLTK